jgi:4-hydroxy-tetrahydrodipicolinate reductase
MKILITGILGKMGRLVAHQAALNPQWILVGGIDTRGRTCNDFPVFSTLDEAPLTDVLIDFSYPDQIDAILSYSKTHQIPLVLATTGYTTEQEQMIADASQHLPIFRSANFSYGILIMRKLLALAGEYLNEGFDIELVEAHHNKKADAPSGTAKLLVKSVNDALPLPRTVVLAHDQGKRNPHVIGVHAIRAGAIAGDHTVLFASESESIEISHRAFSKDVFAQGALRAAAFIVNKSKGLYSMDDLL